MNQNRFVPLPSERISKKKAKNGTTYIYYRTRFYRDEQKKARFDEVAIGKLDDKTGQLIPNRNYDRLFSAGDSKETKAVLPKAVKSAGIPLVFDSLVEINQLRPQLASVFGEQADTILALAYYMAAKGNVISYAEDWLDETAHDFSTVSLSSQRISELFKQMDYAKRQTFLTNWSLYHGKQDFWVYDITSISSYSKGIEQLEWGYNRNHESLPQLNLGICYGQSSQLPLHYQHYNGSIPDKSFLTYMLKQFPTFSDQTIRFVMDQGFLTKDNLEELTKETNSYHILSFVPRHWKDSQRIIHKYAQTVRSSKYRLADYNLYGMKIPCEKVQGVPLTAYLFYDPEKNYLESELLFNQLDHLEEELENIHKKNWKRKKYTTYFTIQEGEGNQAEPLAYEPNYEAIDEKKETCGYFVLLSTDDTLTVEEALFNYRKKDSIEKSFDDLKNVLDFKRLRTHTQETTDGKIFVGFISLIIQSMIRKKLRTSTASKKWTYKQVMIELEKIKQISTQDEQQLLMPLTGKQKEILTLLDIDYKNWK